jgi:hypothetical protein
VDGVVVEEEIEYLNALTVSELRACPRTYLTLCGKRFRHLVDTGTNLNIISSTTYDSFKNRPFLLPTNVKAFGFHSRTQIPLRGEFSTTVKFLDQEILARYLVLNGNADDIIGYSTATALGIVTIKCDNNPLLARTNIIDNCSHIRINGKTQSSRAKWDKIQAIISSARASLAINPITPSPATSTSISPNLSQSCSPLRNQTQSQVSLPTCSPITFTINGNSDIHSLYPKLFDGSVGCLKDFKVTLRVDHTVKPVQQPAYPVEFALTEMTRRKLDTLEKQGIISKVNGERVTWVCPMHPVGKFDDQKNLVDVRITCNAKTFNKALLPHKRHIPSIPELTQIWEGCKWFSKADFNEAFCQACYDDEGRALNVMTTPWGLYCWNRLNMGISTASEIFQELMEKVLAGIPNIKVALDDVAIGTKTEAEHGIVLKQVLDRIAKCGMTLNKKKCVFFAPEIEFFGVTISKDGVKPKKSKYKDLQDCEEPTTTAEVRSFLGLAGYFKTRSPYQSSISTPLRNLVKGHTRFKWDSEERRAYEKLKEIVIQDEMAFFNHKLPTELYVDAGPDGCSSFLTQLDKHNDTIKLVRCDSHAFTDAELRFSHLEKEAFACVWACKTNHVYVYGRRFDLITDALAVKKIFEEDKTRKRTPIRFIRWKSDLSVYNVRFVHREGSKNIADYLSIRFARIHNEVKVMEMHTNETNEQINTIVQECLPTQISMQQLIIATTNDIQINEIKKALKLKYLGNQIDGTLIKPFKAIWNELSVSSDSILMRNDVIIIPTSLQQQVIEHAHEGHMGMQLCKRLLRNICWFPQMDTMIETAVEDCPACAANTATTTTEPIIPTTMPENAWEIIALDNTSNSPTNDYGLGLVDEGSRTTIIKIAKDLTSATAIALCKSIFAQHGVPKVIKTDNGPAFISAAWASFAKQFNFKHQKVTPLHPAANSTAERIMKNNNKTIRCAAIENTSWKTVCRQWLKRYNQTPHSSTKFSPNMLLKGSDMCDILPVLNDRKLTPFIKMQARLNDAIAKDKMKKYADAYQHVKHRDFVLHDPVMVKWNRTSKYMSLFDPVPYRISAINGTMLTATRSDHTVTRNSKFFKLISEQCFLNAMALHRSKEVQNKPPTSTFKVINQTIQNELQPFARETETPPPTPNILQQPNHLLAQDTPATARPPPQRPAMPEIINIYNRLLSAPQAPPRLYVQPQLQPQLQPQPQPQPQSPPQSPQLPPQPPQLPPTTLQIEPQTRSSNRMPRHDYSGAFRVNKKKTH